MAMPGFRFTRPRWVVVPGVLRPLLPAAALLAYGLVLGGAGGWFVAYCVLLAVVFARPVTVGLASLVAQVTGPAPGLTGDGVQMRLRSWRRRLVTVPWPEITVMWFGYVGSRRYLMVTADPRGAHADEWDPRGRRFGRHAAPLMVYVPPSVPEDEVRRAVAELSGGAVTMADRGPQQAPESGEEWPVAEPAPGHGPYRPGPGFRDRRVPARRSVPVLAAIALIGVPLLLDVPPPWYQSWWPGVAAVRTLPDACAVVTGDQAAALDVGGRRRTVNRPAHDECEYDVPKGDLTVILEREHGFATSGSAAAAGRLDELAGRLGGSPSRVAGIGDEAVMVANPPGTTTLIDRGVVRLVARRANVVLVVMYGAEKEPGVAQDAVHAAARAALAGLDVR